MRSTFLIFPLFFIVLTGFAQQEPIFTHYRYNMQAINPAYAGSRKALTMASVSRVQWIGFEGAPNTQTLTLHAPFFQERAGFGIGLVHDGIAKNSLLGMQADFAFRIPVGRFSTLSLGLKGTVSRFSNRTASLNVKDEGDDLLKENFAARTLPNFGAGAYFQKEKFFCGFSVPLMLQDHYEVNNNEPQETGLSTLKDRTYYFISGAVFELHDFLDFKPTTFLKYRTGTPLQIDITGQLVFKNVLFGGFMYRSNESVGMLAGFNFTEQLAASYSFDYSIGNQTGRYNGGSHELMLRYDFYFNHSHSATSPRHF